MPKYRLTKVDTVWSTNIVEADNEEEAYSLCDDVGEWKEVDREFADYVDTEILEP